MHRIQKRFDELAKQAEKLPASDGGPHVHKLIEWRTSVASLLSRVFGENSATYQQFQSFPCREVTVLPTGIKQPRVPFLQLLAVFQSAKSDYEGGYLFDIRDLVHAEVFSNELEQAEHFLNSDYKVAAVVTTGVVLETTIKRICNQNAIDVKNEKDKDIQTDTLITELKRKNVYNEAVAKQLRAWMGVRNDAAHGKRKDGEFESGEVSRMIQGVGEFVTKHMS